MLWSGGRKNELAFSERVSGTCANLQYKSIVEQGLRLRKQRAPAAFFLRYDSNMDSKIAQDERNNFTKRLVESLAAAGVSDKPTNFVAAFNARADGAAVSVYAARKWLNGESIPTHEKVVVLSVWLGVNAAWLRYGDADFRNIAGEVVPESAISSPTFSLLNDILSLPEPAQQTVREIVDAFLKNFGKR